MPDAAPRCDLHHAVSAPCTGVEADHPVGFGQVDARRFVAVVDVRIRIGIGLQDVAPAVRHQPCVVGHGAVPASLRLIVMKNGVWRVDHQVSALAEAKAEIDVVRVDGQALVESADRVERLAAHQQTGGRDRADVADALRSRALETMGMTGEAADAERNPRVLNATVGVQKLRSDGSHLWTRGVLDERTQPLRVARLRVVVEEQHVPPVGLSNGQVVQAREIEGAGRAHDLVRRACEKPERRGLDATIVDDHHLERRIGSGLDRPQASSQHRQSIARGYDDGDFLGRRRHPVHAVHVPLGVPLDVAGDTTAPERGGERPATGVALFGRQRPGDRRRRVDVCEDPGHVHDPGFLLRYTQSEVIEMRAVQVGVQREKTAQKTPPIEHESRPVHPRREQIRGPGGFELGTVTPAGLVA